MLPWLGPDTVTDAMLTRMCSTRSSWSKGPAGSGKMGVSATGAGSGLPVEIWTTVGDVSQVDGGESGSSTGTNSAIVPVTWTRAPTAAAAGGGADVKTKMPSEVAGSASTSASLACTKKPFAVRPVTMPRV